MKLFVGLNIVSILKRTSIERPLRRGSGSLVTLAQIHSAAAPGRLQGFYHLHEPMAEAPDSEKNRGDKWWACFPPAKRVPTPWLPAPVPGTMADLADGTPRTSGVWRCEHACHNHRRHLQLVAGKFRILWCHAFRPRPPPDWTTGTCIWTTGTCILITGSWSNAVLSTGNWPSIGWSTGRWSRHGSCWHKWCSRDGRNANGNWVCCKCILISPCKKTTVSRLPDMDWYGLIWVDMICDRRFWTNSGLITCYHISYSYVFWCLLVLLIMIPLSSFWTYGYLMLLRYFGLPLCPRRQPDPVQSKLT